MANIYFSSELQALMAKRPALKPRIEHTVNDFFPEIEEARFGRASRSAYYDFRSGTIRVNGGSSVYVIGHELVHFMQDPRHYRGPVTYPSGERSCDLFLFARSPALVADVWDGDASYLLHGATARALKTRFSRPAGQRLVHDVCAEAVRLRDAGKRDYIKWAEHAIALRTVS
ncbi:MAG: hypothetical protein A4E28_02178 [Methanocella sp. PtaU1.Bin125]|nr:MAG: hypothetical protein A4E28_02178 [Methanocella sp. PtaU1.Bin125]